MKDYMIGFFAMLGIITAAILLIISIDRTVDWVSDNYSCDARAYGEVMKNE